MTAPTLDERLGAVASLVPMCTHAADIGADHGQLACWLLESNRCMRMTVADISADSLRKARTLLEGRTLNQRVTFAVADGLEALTEPVDVVIIAGMGAQTMLHILTAGQDQLADAVLVLQTHTDHDPLRSWLCENGYRIAKERLVKAAGRYYVVMQAVHGSASYDARELALGPCLLQDRPPLWEPYIAWRLRVTQKALQSVAHARRADAAEQRAELMRMQGWLEEEMYAVHG